jgi:hypothetical protein
VHFAFLWKNLPHHRRLLVLHFALSLSCREKYDMKTNMPLSSIALRPVRQTTREKRKKRMQKNNEEEFIFIPFTHCSHTGAEEHFFRKLIPFSDTSHHDRRRFLLDSR